jgi:hypothetical protein
MPVLRDDRDRHPRESEGDPVEHARGPGPAQQVLGADLDRLGGDRLLQARAQRGGKVGVEW